MSVLSKCSNLWTLSQAPEINYSAYRLLLERFCTELHNLLYKVFISSICLPFQNLCLFTDLLCILPAFPDRQLLLLTFWNSLVLLSSWSSILSTPSICGHCWLAVTNFSDSHITLLHYSSISVMPCVLERISYMLSCESFLKEDLLLIMFPKIMGYYVMLNIFPSKLFAVVFLLLLSLRFVAYGTL